MKITYLFWSSNQHDLLLTPNDLLSSADFETFSLIFLNLKDNLHQLYYEKLIKQLSRKKAWLA